MSSQLIDLITNSKNIKIQNKSKIKPTQNFILEILKDLEPKKAIELLKNLKLTTKEIKEIISKLPQKDKKLYSKLLSEIDIVKISSNLNLNIKNQIEKINTTNTKQDTSNNNIENNLKTLKKDLDQLIRKYLTSDLYIKNDNLNTEKNSQSLKKENKHLHILQSANLENIMSLIFNPPQNISQTLKKDINNIKQHITELIKKEIDTNQIINSKILTKKVINEIKNADSFKELISISNKNGLDIKKFIIKIIKTTPQKPQYFPQLKTHNLKIIKTKNHINISPSKHLKHQKNKKNNILQTLIIHKNTNTNKIIQNKNINITNFTIFNDKTEIKDNKDNKKKDILTNNFNSNIEIKHKILQAKESIKHFSNNLKEAIENYKPPISKISVELHPKELGKVEVTIVHRGDNLQININSNNQAINFFHSHQNELKNALVNMGYSEIDMNFNSNQNKNNQEKKAFKNYSTNKKDENYDELIIEIPYTYA